MIKCIIFDLDGVLVDCKELHYEALNKALSEIDNKYIITKDEHLTKYDGLNTQRKLEILNRDKGLPISMFEHVWQAKQRYTTELIHNFVIDKRLQEILAKLKKERFFICVASNSIRETVRLLLGKRGLLEYVDTIYSNQDVWKPKPNAEMYLRCMIIAGVGPNQTLIIEDSPIGRKGAAESGAHVLPVKDSNEVTYERIMNKINSLSCKTESPTWEGDINIVVPMAGAGSRFVQAGYTFPKPIIETLDGKPMIQLVVESLGIKGNYIYLVNSEHYKTYHLHYLLNFITPNCKIICVDQLTEGAACTVLLASDLIDNSKELIIANSDQFIKWNPMDFMYKMGCSAIDGGILTFRSTHPKWSYVQVDENGIVTDLREKQVISNIATVGIYYWKHGENYVKYAKQMISKNLRVNNEFYVAPVYLEAIQDGKKISTFDVNEMWGTGTPDDLKYFLSNYKK